ncbi:putative eukaryotic translation initiation factor [Lasiosphaeris hirsuta]|uniref:Eukaryotic translation initiation factor n=1 Tax=Lasiosphaeris hirsuta TaxID=260670 RepID=A0AA40B0F6_9PEZI|nr:putative eukaryotic translation initiation factor [Lasiosphaeris hirsuta]
MSTPAAAPQGFRQLPLKFDVPDGINKRVDLPPEAYMRKPEPFPRRPGYNKAGQPIRVQANQFRVKSVSNVDVFTYDVAVSPDPKHSIIYEKIWALPIVKQKLATFKHPWIYDNKALAWSMNKVPGDRMLMAVDLGVPEGRPGKPNNMYNLTLRITGTVRLAALNSYLKGSASWDTGVLECMSFLDHVLRQGAMERFKLIKRSFFNLESQTMQFNDYTEAVKGIYSAIRLNDSINSGGRGLGVNVDVSNQTFWVGQKFEQLVRNFVNALGGRSSNLQYLDVNRKLLPVKNGASWAPSETFKALKRLQKVKFVTTHSKDSKVYSVGRFAFDAKYGADGANAKKVVFLRRVEGQDEPVETSIYDYYAQRYNVRLQYWWFPLIETTKKGYFPFELCLVERLNPYPFKLDGDQTQKMIRFAVQRPAERKAEIMNSVANLNWAGDRYLKSFGISIDPQMPVIPARLLKNPEIEFAAKSKLDPRTTGRWDLRGKKFVKPNLQPLKSWGFVALQNTVDMKTLENFANVFTATYRGHGGIIESKPYLDVIPSHVSPTPEQVVTVSYQKCGAHQKVVPQLLFFVVKEKAAFPYEKMKAAADCRHGIPSQMVLAQKVRQAQPQYCSNVSMKVNAKLGGQTSRIFGDTFNKVPTMFIGVDVSHAAPGSQQPSMAAMCASVDKDAAIYDAAVQTNGWRTEILTPENTNQMLGPMIEDFRGRNRVQIEHVFYMRDGVSEGQFAHVIEYELTEIKKTFMEIQNKIPKITVIIATKRHHIRFFPERGDRNGNCFPGTLVEREVTHPFQYDFYLCSHSAIQGTARPVHYNVIHDEIKKSPDDLQKMIYQHCYQYCRSTTPVSLHPAVYYAHLASNRGRAHEPDTTAQASGTKSQQGPTVTSALQNLPCNKVEPLGKTAHPSMLGLLAKRMWFV